jgi:hypothetical protein
MESIPNSVAASIRLIPKPPGYPNSSKKCRQRTDAEAKR